MKYPPVSPAWLFSQLRTAYFPEFWAGEGIAGGALFVIFNPSTIGGGTISSAIIANFTIILLFLKRLKESSSAENLIKVPSLVSSIFFILPSLHPSSPFPFLRHSLTFSVEVFASSEYPAYLPNRS